METEPQDVGRLRRRRKKKQQKIGSIWLGKQIHNERIISDMILHYNQIS